MSAQGEPFGRTGKGLESILQQHLKLVLLLLVLVEGSAAAADSTAGHLSSSSVELLLSKEPPNNLFTNPQVSCFIIFLPACQKPQKFLLLDLFSSSSSVSKLVSCWEMLE